MKLFFEKPIHSKRTFFTFIGKQVNLNFNILFSLVNKKFIEFFQKFKLTS